MCGRIKKKSRARSKAAGLQLELAAEVERAPTEAALVAPDAPFPSSDPGDETARRFFYQYSYAAILLCALLDDATGVVEVLCEHHEDVLLKFSDGLFVAIQVKTRASGVDPWRASDEEILGSLERFARLEAQFNGQFSKFVIASNHAFLRGKSTKADLSYLLDLAGSTPTEHHCDPKLRPLVDRLAEATPCPASTILAMLKKCHLDDTLPKLSSAKKELQNSLVGAWPLVGGLPYDTVMRASSDLVAECGRASALDHSQCLPAYLSATPAGPDIAMKARLDGKRFDRIRIKQLVERFVTPAALLDGQAATLPLPTGSTEVLERKLALGGFSVVSVNAARDLRAAADYQGVEWLSRFGDQEGLRRHGHIRAIVQSDCATSYEATKAAEQTFGPQMQAKLRELIHNRRAAGATQLFDCSNEHLEGHAYSLTSECRVVWSDPPPRFGEDAHGPGAVAG